MHLPVNAYAIGPSLHDWEREEWEEQEIKRDLTEERFNADFRVWQRLTYCDNDKKNGKADIEDKMSDALDMIFNDEKARQKFNFLLFITYCSDDHRNTLREMIDLYLKRVYQREWIQEAA